MLIGDDILLRLSKKKIMVILAERGMKISGLADLLGMRANNLSALLGRGTCYPTTAGKIASVLKVPVESIVED